MRIAWFTPFSTHSAIGEFSRHVTGALATHADVEIWTADGLPHHPTQLPVHRFSATADLGEALGERDLAVYNMGNHLGFHGAIHEVSQRHPGVVILHDRVLHHMFVQSWMDEEGVVGASYPARMSEYYGRAGERAARDSLAGVRAPVWESDHEITRYPLDEEAVRRAFGVVTHAHAHAHRIGERWFGPVTVLALPSYRELLARGGRAGTQPPARADGRLQLTTIGHLVANKNVNPFVSLLCADRDLAACVHYTVVGPVEREQPYAVELARLMDSEPALSAELLGWREESELDRLSAATDIFVNLRWPVTEGGSASLARQLAFGRPVLCFDEGSFGELPEGTVARVPAGDFAAAGRELECLLREPELRRRIGERARALAERRDEREYVRGLIAFFAEVARAMRGLRLLNRAADELAIRGVQPHSPLLAELARDFQRTVAA